ncbi:3,9-dihydroxypterocarpan 6A-monooxygenase-like [Neltuma alba]|uniref:3,9-dihydroxypterocarpan 6A-monooxygenase-like n=1 Tax=Neltuma alba TaxID=207710 RepID=UPI0010A38655|nr:3,9-dihydroxypterocarpan 6A-monooxygenase-like [Prosopis alba]
MEINNILGSNYALFFMIWLASLILVRSIFSKQPKARLPPGPLALPIIGHFHLLRPPVHQALHKLSSRYGPMILIYLGSVPWFVVSSSEIVKEILKTHEISFCNRPPSSAVKYLTYNAADFAFAPYGTYWKFMKKLCMSELLNGRVLDLLLPARQEEICHFLQVILKKAHAGEAVDVGAELVRLANSVVMRMALNKSFCTNDEEAYEVAQAVKESARVSGRLNLSDYFWLFKFLDLQGIGKKLKEVHERSDARLESILREHERARIKSNRKDAPEDILDLLLNISEDPSSDVRITRDNIKAFLKDIFLGGTGTIAVGVEWAVAELINHPEIMEKARKEIEQVTGNERIVNESDIVNLPYVQAIVKESLRLHPPAPVILRESTESCNIAGYEIPANSRVVINIWALGRDPKYWDDPLEFKPERFTREDQKSQMEVRGQNYNILPFGSGRRGCPGASLALNIFHTTLAAMIQCFEWKPAGGDGEKNAISTIDMEEGSSVDLQRAHPLICIPKPRFLPFPLQ